MRRKNAWWNWVREVMLLTLVSKWNPINSHNLYCYHLILHPLWLGIFPIALTGVPAPLVSSFPCPVTSSILSPSRPLMCRHTGLLVISPADQGTSHPRSTEFDAFLTKIVSLSIAYCMQIIYSSPFWLVWLISIYPLITKLSVTFSKKPTLTLKLESFC